MPPLFSLGTSSRIGPGRRLAATSLAALALFAGRCYHKGDYSPTAPAVLDALTLTTEGQQAVLPADGISRLRVIARLDPAADPDKRTVLFSTTGGTLIGSADASGQVAVAADVEGVATVELQSPQQVGSAVVTAGVQNVPGLSRQLVISFVAADPDNLLRFTAAPTTAPADGATVSTFTVQLSPSYPFGTPVQFQSTAGLFQPENTAMVSRVASASYAVSADLASAATIGSARVSATAQNVSRQATIAFQRALPDLVTVSTNGTLEAPATSSSGVTVVGTFLRDVGKVTPGTVATFRATTADGAPIGFFRDATTVGSDGTATATFVAGETPYRGRATLRVGAEGSAVSGSTDVTVVDPP